MSILTKNEIKKRLGNDIIINPYNEENLNPNSYDLTLSNELLVYSKNIVDSKIKNDTYKIIIPENGTLLYFGELYLAKTNEWTETYNLIPELRGKSSIGRLGLQVHISGFGDIGFRGNWTLQLIPIKNIKVYVGMKICQIIYNTIEGQIESEYNGKYQNSDRIEDSKNYMDYVNGVFK